MKNKVIFIAFLLIFAQNASAFYFHYEGGESYTGSAYYGAQSISSPLSVSCAPIQNSGSTGETITWFTSTTGGAGNYKFSWSGSDGLFGTNSTVGKVYNTPGDKFATVTVTSGAQSITAGCNRPISIAQTIIAEPKPAPTTANNPEVTKKPTTPASSGTIAGAGAKGTKVNESPNGNDGTDVKRNGFFSSVSNLIAGAFKGWPFSSIKNLFSGESCSGFGGSLLLVLLALCAIGIAIILATRKEQKEREKNKTEKIH